MAASCSAGDMPSGGAARAPPAICRRRPDTRIMKNSSRLLEKIARNFARSSSFCFGSRASDRTRRLNSIQLNSRLM